MAGIVHFSHFFRFMEEAEHAFLRYRDLTVFMEENGEILSWPRLSATCEFHSPARFNDLLDVRVEVERVSRKTLTYKFLLSVSGRQVATGRMVVVCCRMPKDGPIKAIEIPPGILDRLTGKGAA